MRVLLYSPANLNVIDGSSIWVQSAAETLHVDKRITITLPLKAPERRDLITRLLRRLERVELVDPRTFRRADPRGLRNDEALDLVEHLDGKRRFDALILRSFALCLEGARRPSLRGRLWSSYVLEPERELESPAYLAELSEIAEASRYVVAQSEEMRAVLETFVPAARSRTILMPPAIPTETSARPDPGRSVERLIYTGKFHPFYPVTELIGLFAELRRERPGMEFHVAGDKIHRPPSDPGYAPALEAALMETDGVVWHGGLGRDDVERILANGGVALSVWDKRHGPWMNDLVVSTKLLDYCSVGLPVVLSRTAAQEELLGVDYPLFVTEMDEVLPLLRRVFADPALYSEAGERTWQASRRFTYPEVHRRLAPFLAPSEQGGRDDLSPAERALVDRPKLPGSRFNVGSLAGGAQQGDFARELLRLLRETDERFRLVALVATDDLPSWLRTVSHIVPGDEDDATAAALLARAVASGCHALPAGQPAEVAAALLAGLPQGAVPAASA